jgi:hypothetical protein
MSKREKQSWLDKLRRLGRPAKEATPPEPPITIPEVVVKRPGQSSAERQAAGQDSAMSAADAVAWRTAMLNQLTVADLDDISRQMGIASDALPGGKGRKTLALMQHCQRRGTLRDLQAACRARQPNAPWPSSDS